MWEEVGDLVDEGELARTDNRSQNEELRCVLAVIRHGGEAGARCSAVSLFAASWAWTSPAVHCRAARCCSAVDRGAGRVTLGALSCCGVAVLPCCRDEVREPVRG